MTALKYQVCRLNVFIVFNVFNVKYGLTLTQLEYELIFIDSGALGCNTEPHQGTSQMPAVGDVASTAETVNVEHCRQRTPVFSVV